MLEWWTNRSRLPSSGVMKPKPFSSENHLTFPVAIGSFPPGNLKCCYPDGNAFHPRPAPTYLSPLRGLSAGKEGRRGGFQKPCANLHSSATCHHLPRHGRPNAPARFHRASPPRDRPASVPLVGSRRPT